MGWRAWSVLAVLFVLFIPDVGTSGDADEAQGLRALYQKPTTKWPAAWVDPTVDFRELGALERNAPASKAQAQLGERLFHDPLLSASGQISCATCHDPAKGWADGRVLPVGATLSARHTPSLFSVAYRRSFGWDGATDSLHQQSQRPLLAHDEMGNPDLAAVIDRLEADPTYPALFAEAFGEVPIDGERLGDTLAAFQAGLEQETRFDRFARGDHDALSDQEIAGLHLFRTKAGCANCHFGPLLTDERFHNLGLAAIGEPREDLGRYRATGDIEDAGKFRTPSLRHIGRTAPYMHGGLFPTLTGVVNFYARGGGEVATRSAEEAQQPLHRAVSRISPLVHPLALDKAETAALVAFLLIL